MENEKDGAELIFEGKFGKETHVLVFRNGQRYSILEKEQKDMSVVGRGYELDEMLGIISTFAETHQGWAIIFTNEITKEEKEGFLDFLYKKESYKSREDFMTGKYVYFSEPSIIFPSIRMKIVRFIEKGEAKYIIFIKKNRKNRCKIAGEPFTLIEIGNILKELIKLDLFKIEISNYSGDWTMKEIKDLAKLLKAQMFCGPDERENTFGIESFTIEKCINNIVIFSKV